MITVMDKCEIRWSWQSETTELIYKTLLWPLTIASFCFRSVDFISATVAARAPTYTVGVVSSADTTRRPFPVGQTMGEEK